MPDSSGENAVHEMFPYLRVRNAAAAIEFYKKVFGAEEMMRLTEPGGRIGHVELKFGSAMVMLSEEHPERGIHSPLTFGGTGSLLHLHVSDVDAMTRRAVECGARITMPPTNQFYGERSSKFVDPYGHEWMLGQHIERVSPEDMQKRYTAMFAANPPAQT